MSNIHLTFSSQNSAFSALTKINQNMGLPLVSINAQTHLAEPDDQMTLAWNNLAKAHEIELWYFQKPTLATDMVDVIGFSEQEFDANWLPPQTI